MKIYLSFSGLCKLMAENLVSGEDLNSGLFFFGCMRCHALDPAADGPRNNDATWGFDGKWNATAKANHRRLKHALMRAEKATPKRAGYKKVRYSHAGSLSRLNTLLRANGLKPIKFEGDNLPGHPDVKDLIVAQNPEIVVLW